MGLNENGTVFGVEGDWINCTISLIPLFAKMSEAKIEMALNILDF